MEINTIERIINLVMKNNIRELEMRSEKDYIRILTNKDNFEKQLNTANIKGKFNVSQEKIIKFKEEKSKSILEKMKKNTYIRSPIAGTVYLSSGPYQENFVQANQNVSNGDTLCLVESMKTFTKITSHSEGVITKCLVENGQNVDAKQVLFVIDGI